MRRVLLLGFAAIFVLWIVSAYELVRRVAEVETQTTAITRRFTEGEELLFTVRAQVLLGSVYARDAVVDTGPDAASSYRKRLQATRLQIEQAMRRYLPDVDSAEERAHWTQLEIQLRDYWDSMAPVLAGQVLGSPADARAFLRREVMPKREAILRISEGIRILNQDALAQQQRDVADLHRGLRQRIWWTSGVAVALGLGIAVISIRYAGRLESQVRRQHLDEVQHKRDLQRLSAKLVRAQEEERRAMARDLHDEIGQALTAIMMEFAVVERGLAGSGAARQPLAGARAMTEAALHTVRDLSQLLHPAMLDDFGLPHTLKSYLRSVSDRTGVRTQLVLDRMEERLPADLEVGTYRIVQEALTNVAKHAQATSCRVYVQRLPYSLLLTVEDDGRGMDPERATRDDPGRGLGLMGIRERASEFGGTFRLESRVGHGTRLTVELPVSASSTPAETREAEVETATAPASRREVLDGQHAAPLAR
jgi:signal transduction histidine kinase